MYPNAVTGTEPKRTATETFILINKIPEPNRNFQIKYVHLGSKIK